MVWVEIWIFPVKLRLGKEFATTSLHMTNRELHYVSFQYRRTPREKNEICSRRWAAAASLSCALHPEMKECTSGSGKFAQWE
jgi:hypothetical protein